MIHENLQRIAAGALRTSGLRYRGGFVSYAEAAERVARLAAGLQAHGVGPGDSVAILMVNSPELFIVCHALFAIGAIGMPLSVSGTQAEYAVAARLANIKAVIAGQDLGAPAVRLAGEIGGDAGPLPVFLSGDEEETSLGRLQRSPFANLPAIGADADALYLLSSGSTGLPKIVPHTHAEILADARRTSAVWSLTPDDVVFDMLPSNFAMGLLLGATNALEGGATTVYWNDPRPLVLTRQLALEAMAAERVTMMGAVPTMYETLSAARGDYRLSLRLAFSGGAALKRSTFEQVRDRLGIVLRQDYGSTEAIMVAHNDAEDPDLTWDSVGRPAGDARAKIAPMDTEFGPDVGELMIATSSLTRGYLGEPDANARTFVDGWLMTGDLARLDDAGNIHIKGRTKLLIDVAGFKIDPLEVEETLVQHAAVAEAVVVGDRKTPRGEQRLKAFVVRSGEVSELNLIRHLRERLSVHKVPAAIEFLDELPKSTAGKVMRQRLSERG